MISEPNNVAFGAMWQGGVVWLTSATAIIHREGKLVLEHNGRIVDTFPHDEVICRGDAVNLLRRAWTWAIGRIAQLDTI